MKRFLAKLFYKIGLNKLSRSISVEVYYELEAERWKRITVEAVNSMAAFAKAYIKSAKEVADQLQTNNDDEE